MNSAPIPPTSGASVTDEDQFHNAYRIFHMAVVIAALPAEEQCAAMGSYNVAWELRDDVSAGRYLLGRGYLSTLQEERVATLVEAVKLVPASALPAGTGIASNIEAMSHASWQPVRVLATEVLRQLAPFTAANATYLGLPQNAA
jgi:hypothetical protein